MRPYKTWPPVPVYFMQNAQLCQVSNVRLSFFTWLNSIPVCNTFYYPLWPLFCFLLAIETSTAITKRVRYFLTPTSFILDMCSVPGLLHITDLFLDAWRNCVCFCRVTLPCVICASGYMWAPLSPSPCPKLLYFIFFARNIHIEKYCCWFLSCKFQSNQWKVQLPQSLNCH